MTITCRLFVGKIFATWDYAGHSGQDIVALEDLRILNLLEGVVTGLYKNTNDAGYGCIIRTTQQEYNGRNVYNSYVHYMHMKEMAYVSVGDHVGIGQVIGYMGNTGNSTGAHTHVSWRNPSGVWYGRGNESFITGVPLQSIGGSGTTYDNDYDPSIPYIPKKIKTWRSKKIKMIINSVNYYRNRIGYRI